MIVEPPERAIPPQPGFLAQLREITRRRKIVLIFDEVVTGFRLAYGSAQEFYGVTPDLATYGKALTCGYSLAAIAGRADLMATADPTRKGTLDWACLSGTLSGNPIACAAGVAALTELKRPGVYDRLAALGRMLREGLARVAAGRGVLLQALGEGPIAQPIFIDPAVRVTADHDLRMGRRQEGHAARPRAHPARRVRDSRREDVHLAGAHGRGHRAYARGVRRGADGALTPTDSVPVAFSYKAA